LYDTTYVLFDTQYVSYDMQYYTIKYDMKFVLSNTLSSDFNWGFQLDFSFKAIIYSYKI